MMASNATGRTRLPNIPPDHDVLGHPELRDQQGGSDGLTHFQQIGPSTSNQDVTKLTPAHKSGDFKFSPGGAGV